MTAAATSPLPDAVPRPAPRLSLAAPRPAPRNPPPVQTKWPSRSPFTKYIAGGSPNAASSIAVPSGPRVPVAVSRTTRCFNLPDVVLDVAGSIPVPSVPRLPVAVSSTTHCFKLPDVLLDAVDPAPSAVPSAAPLVAPMAATVEAAPKATPSSAPRRPSGSARCARCHPPAQASRPTHRPRPTPSKRRPQKGEEDQLFSVQLAAAVSKCSAAKCAAPKTAVATPPLLNAAPVLRHDWLRQREDDLEKMLKQAAVHRAAPGAGAVAARSAARKDEWVGIGNNLRELADGFDKTLMVSIVSNASVHVRMRSAAQRSPFHRLDVNYFPRPPFCRRQGISLGGAAAKVRCDCRCAALHHANALTPGRRQADASGAGTAPFSGCSVAHELVIFCHAIKKLWCALCRPCIGKQQQ